LGEGGSGSTPTSSRGGNDRRGKKSKRRLLETTVTCTVRWVRVKRQMKKRTSGGGPERHREPSKQLKVKSDKHNAASIRSSALQKWFLKKRSRREEKKYH